MKNWIIILSVIGILSCGKEKKEVDKIKTQETKEEVPISKKDLNATDTKSSVVFTDNKVQQIYNQYIEVKRSLVNANPDRVRQEARKMYNSIDRTEKNKQFRATSQLLSLTKDLNKQRDFFVTITSEMEQMVKNAAITSGEIYKQFCPMAFEGKGGYWLSDSKEVRNPYYGDKMLKCGSVIHTVK